MVSTCLFQQLFGRYFVLLVPQDVLLRQKRLDAFIVCWELLCMVSDLVEVVLRVPFFELAHLFGLLIDESVNDATEATPVQIFVANDLADVIYDCVFDSGRPLQLLGVELTWSEFQITQRSER